MRQGVERKKGEDQQWSLETGEKRRASKDGLESSRSGWVGKPREVLRQWMTGDLEQSACWGRSDESLIWPQRLALGSFARASGAMLCSQYAAKVRDLLLGSVCSQVHKHLLVSRRPLTEPAGSAPSLFGLYIKRAHGDGLGG